MPLFPLAGAALMFFIGRGLKNSAVSAICVGSVAISFVFALGAFFQLVGLPEASAWWKGPCSIGFPRCRCTRIRARSGVSRPRGDFCFDPLSGVMILVVTGVGLLIHIYSVGYMAHEGGYYRFFGYLNLFMFSMLLLVLANNLLVLFVGWEGVGTCSYLLIGFWFKKKSASDAGKKAFIVNRVGDSGFLLGIFLTSALLGTIRFTEIGPALANAHIGVGAPLVTAIALLFFCGRDGEIGADSALRVAAGCDGRADASERVNPRGDDGDRGRVHGHADECDFQLSPRGMAVVAVVGAVTAIFAASIGVLQNDIKRVLAYSTISQLGYMFLACGVGAFSAGIFHLLTHAFFKGLLFLGAGSVIHAVSGEQDMQKMGALSGKIRTAYLTMLAATLAIAGIPPLAGFFSKDEILAHAFQANHALWFVGWHGGNDGVLHVPAAVPDLPRDFTRAARGRAPHSRIALEHDRAARHPRTAFDCGRVDRNRWAI